MPTRSGQRSLMRSAMRARSRCGCEAAPTCASRACARSRSSVRALRPPTALMWARKWRQRWPSGAGRSSPVDRKQHNRQDLGSNPMPVLATTENHDFGTATVIVDFDARTVEIYADNSLTIDADWAAVCELLARYDIGALSEPMGCDSDSSLYGGPLPY